MWRDLPPPINCGAPIDAELGRGSDSTRVIKFPDGLECAGKVLCLSRQGVKVFVAHLNSIDVVVETLAQLDPKRDDADGSASEENLISHG